MINELIKIMWIKNPTIWFLNYMLKEKKHQNPLINYYDMDFWK
jgi:hypothetical protein